MSSRFLEENDSVRLNKFENCQKLFLWNSVGVFSEFQRIGVRVAGGFFLLAFMSCDKLGTIKEKLVELKKEDQTVKEVTSAPMTAPPVSSISEQSVVELNEANYQEFVSKPDALMIVDYHAPWCGPCRQLGPILEAAVSAKPGVVYLGKVNVDVAPDLARTQGVNGIPDVRFFKNGKEVDRFVGYPGPSQVESLIGKWSAGVAPVSVPAAVPPPTSAIGSNGKTPSGKPAGEPEKKPEPTMQPFEKGWMPKGMSRKGES